MAELATAKISPRAARIVVMLSPLPWERQVKGDIRIDSRSGVVQFDRVYAPRLIAQAHAPGFPAGDRALIDRAAATLGRSRGRWALLAAGAMRGRRAPIHHHAHGGR